MPSPTSVPTGARTPSPTPAEPTVEASSPVVGSGAADAGSRSGGPPADGGSAATNPFTVGGESTGDRVDAAFLTSSLGRLDGIVWAVPTLALTVPGLLLVIAILAQIAAGTAWLPLVRRKIGSSFSWRSFEGRRRHRDG
jgi:hypothetical protein